MKISMGHFTASVVLLSLLAVGAYSKKAQAQQQYPILDQGGSENRPEVSDFDLRAVVGKEKPESSTECGGTKSNSVASRGCPDARRIDQQSSGSHRQ